MDQINRLIAQVSHPAGSLTGLGPQAGNGTQATTQMEKIIGQVIGILTLVAVIWFAIQIIIAGYNFINSEGDPKKMDVARHRLTEGVLGLVIVVVALGLGSLIANLAGIPNILNLEAMFTNMGL